MGKIGCYKCGKEYGTNPDCACWGYEERKGAPMRGNNWWIGGWAESCSRCGLKIEDDVSIYCSNCGKFLAEIRPFVWAFPLASLILFIVGGVGLLIAYSGSGHYAGGDYIESAWWFAGILGGIAVAAILAVKPLGNFVLRREEWAEEAERRNAENRAERERSANAKSGIDVRIETGDLKKAHEMLKGHMEKFSIGFGKKPSIKVPLTDEEGNPLGIIDLENGEAGATLDAMAKGGFRLDGERNEDGTLQSLWLGEPPLPREDFPLFDSNGFARRKVGSVLVREPSRLRKCINSGAQLFYTTMAGGKIDSFCLGPIEPTNEGAFDKNKMDPAFNIRSVLPVRNGPVLQIAFIDSPDNRESLEDIKRNLEDVYRVKSAGIWKKVEQLARAATETLKWREELDDEDRPYFEAASPYHDDGAPFLFRIKRTEDCSMWKLDHDAELMRPDDKSMRYSSLDAAMMACETARSEILFEELEGKKTTVTFTTLSKGLDKFTDIGCSCGRKNRVIYLRSEFICPCGKRYVNTSEGWRPELRCRLIFGSEACVGTFGENGPTDWCIKTLADCRRNGNEERFAP